MRKWFKSYISGRYINGELRYEMRERISEMGGGSMGFRPSPNCIQRFINVYLNSCQHIYIFNHIKYIAVNCNRNNVWIWTSPKQISIILRVDYIIIIFAQRPGRRCIQPMEWLYNFQQHYYTPLSRFTPKNQHHGKVVVGGYSNVYIQYTCALHTDFGLEGSKYTHHYRGGMARLIIYNII